MNTKAFGSLHNLAVGIGLAGAFALGASVPGMVAISWAYPPAVGILSNSPNCLACHLSNGPWQDDENLIIDVLDKDTKASLRQQDGSFQIAVPKNQTRTVLTVIGRKAGDKAEAPYRNAWLYIDPQSIGNSSLYKFPPGWEVNLPISCRLVGDAIDIYPGARVTVLPMTLRATESAADATIQLQAMLTKGEAIKGKAKEEMIGNYYERTVRLVVK